MVGLPLSIELVAAWVDELPAAQLASAIEYRLGSFSAGPSARPPAEPSAEQALKAALSTVWDQLSLSKRGALSKLAFFPDPFDEDAASDVADVSPAALEGLAKKGTLVRRAPGRYGWHPALRRYTFSRSREAASGRGAGDQSVDPGELERRYRRHYLDGLARRAVGLRGLGAKASAAEIRRDWSHVRRAWISAVAHADVGILKHSLDGLSRFLSLQGWLREGVALLEGGVRALTDREEAPQDGEWLLSMIRLMVEQARLLNAQSLPRRAGPVAESAVELARTRRSQASSADAWTAVEAAGHREWGRALHGQGRLQAATDRLAEALALTRDGPPEVRASILTSLGALERDREKPDRARELLDQALALYAEGEDSWGRSQVLNELALVAETRSELAAAAAYAQETLSLSQTMGRRDLESAAHASLGRIALAGETYGAATDHCEQALSIARERGDPRAEARALLALARIHLEEGKREEAWRRSLLAVEQARVSEDPLIEARALLISGHAFTELGMTDQAFKAYERARQLQVRLGQPGQVIESLTGLARATLGRGDPAEAQTFVEEILSRLEEGDLVGVSDPVRVYLACYQVLEANGDPRAREVLGAASGLYEGAPTDLSRSLDF
jgi:tetratricopeptide (TPR) repeat protein